MSKKGVRLNLRGNMVGGINASIVSFPKCVAYGALVFAPLGPEYYSFGVLSGVISYVMVNLVTTFYYGNKILSGGPSSLPSIMLASSLVLIINALSAAGNLSNENVLAFFFLLVLMVSFIQLIFGLFRVGELTKYIPYPVISGIANGGALLILNSQIESFLGLPSRFHIRSAFSGYGAFLEDINVPLAVMGAAIVMVLILCRKYFNKIPGPLVGIVFGSIVFYAVPLFSPGYYLGDTIGDIPISIWDISSISRADLLFTPQLFLANIPLCRQLLGPAVSIAVVITLNCLLTQSASDSLLYSRSKSSREIIAQSMGNMACGILGGFPGNPSFSRTFLSYKTGATNSLSKLFSALATIVIVLLLKPLLPLIPKICFTAIIIMLAFSRFDKWFLKLFPKIFSKSRYYRNKGLLNILIVMIVIISMIIFGVFQAVGIGILISVLLFVVRMGKTIIRRQYSGTRMRSNVERPMREIEILKKCGSRIRILELEGSLFFGSSDRLNGYVHDIVTKKVSYIILDFKHVSDFDLSGTNVIRNMIKTCYRNNAILILSSVRRNSELDQILDLKENVFESLEDALAWAEDQLIRGQVSEEELEKELPLAKLDALDHLKKGDFEILSRYLERIEFQRERIIFSENAPGDAIYFLVRGRANIFKKLSGGRRKRLSTISQGTVFGEMALIDGEPRSAGVISATQIVCYRLDKSRLENLSKRHPDLAIKILTGIGKELSKRMRISIAMNTVLQR